MSQATYLKSIENQVKARYIFASIAFLAFAALFIYPFTSDLLEQYGTLQETQETVSASEEKLASERLDYRELKDTYAKTATADADKIKTILPANYSETDIIRMIEQGVSSLTTPDAPLFFESANFSKAVIKEDVAYQVVPFKVTLSANRPAPLRPADPQGDSIAPFLKFIEDTGVVQSDKAQRLISVENVSITQRDEQKTDPKGTKIGNVTLELTLSAYALPNAKVAKKADSTAKPASDAAAPKEGGDKPAEAVPAA